MKKRDILRLAVVTVGLFLSGGCSDFLEEESSEYAYATSCKDLNELLVGSGYMKHSVLGFKDQLKPDSKTGAYFPWLNVSYRSEEHTSELQSRGLISYAVFCLKKKMDRIAEAIVVA